MSLPRVLLVEDHPQMQTAITDLLLPCCDVIGVVSRGDEAFDAAMHLQPEAVILDISLPGRSGMQLLPELRRGLPMTAIIIFTAQTSRLYREEAFRRGADDFLQKGSDGERLVGAVQEHTRLRSPAATGSLPQQAIPHP